MLFCNKRKLFSDNKALGKWGEKRCEKYLRKRGLKTLTRNYLCKTGELDLVMVDTDGTIIFIEVKTRTGEDYTPAENALTAAKKQRMSRAAQYFLKTNNVNDRPFRFDFVTVVLDQTGNETIKHYPNAFC
jgi:putative endonuclease